MMNIHMSVTTTHKLWLNVVVSKYNWSTNVDVRIMLKPPPQAPPKLPHAQLGKVFVFILLCLFPSPNENWSHKMEFIAYPPPFRKNWNEGLPKSLIPTYTWGVVYTYIPPPQAGNLSREIPLSLYVLRSGTQYQGQATMVFLTYAWPRCVMVPYT